MPSSEAIDAAPRGGRLGYPQEAVVAGPTRRGRTGCGWLKHAGTRLSSGGRHARARAWPGDRHTGRALPQAGRPLRTGVRGPARRAVLASIAPRSRSPGGFFPYGYGEGAAAGGLREDVAEQGPHEGGVGVKPWAGQAGRRAAAPHREPGPGEPRPARTPPHTEGAAPPGSSGGGRPCWLLAVVRVSRGGRRWGCGRRRPRSSPRRRRRSRLRWAPVRRRPWSRRRSRRRRWSPRWGRWWRAGAPAGRAAAAGVPGWCPGSGWAGCCPSRCSGRRLFRCAGRFALSGGLAAPEPGGDLRQGGVARAGTPVPHHRALGRTELVGVGEQDGSSRSPQSRACHSCPWHAPCCPEPDCGTARGATVRTTAGS